MRLARTIRKGFKALEEDDEKDDRPVRKRTGHQSITQTVRRNFSDPMRNLEIVDGMICPSCYHHKMFKKLRSLGRSEPIYQCCRCKRQHPL
jgi:hypothetical protein